MHATSTAVELPDRLRSRPRDRRGFVIPFTAEIRPDGQPEFRSVCQDAWMRCVSGRICAMCGQPLGAFLAFVGGPLSMENRCFTDPAMHRTCAEYALQVCPFLALPSMHMRSADKVASNQVVRELASDINPGRFGLGLTKRYQLARVGADVVIHVPMWLEVVWWAKGSPEA